MDTPRRGLGLLPVLLVCLWAGLALRAGAEPTITLEAQVEGTWLRVLAIEQKHLVGAGAAGPRAIPETAPLRLTGDLATRPEVVEATTVFEVAEDVPPSDAPRPPCWRASNIRPVAEFLAGTAGRWRAAQPERAVLVCAWQVSGRPLQVRALPLLDDAQGGFTAPACSFKLTAEERPGNPVILLFEQGQALPKQVAAEHAAADRLGVLAALGQDDFVAAELLRLGHVPAQAKETPLLLQVTAQAGAVRALEALLRLGAPVRAKTADDATALHWAARAGRLPTVLALLAAKAPLGATDGMLNTPLHLAANGAHAEICRQLIEAGAPLNPPNRYGVKPAFSALLANCTPPVELLLARKADLGLNDYIRDRVLVRKAAAGQRRLVQILLSQHADPNAKWLNQTPLLAACREGYEGIVADLLAAQADPNLAGPKGATPLLTAASRGHAAVVQQLLAGGADPTTAGNGGHTALHAAAFAGSASTIQALLAAGVPVDPATDHGVTPLTFALGSGSRDAVETLLAAGAQVAPASPRFEAELNAALAMDSAAFVAAALKAGMEVGRRTQTGWSVLQLARVGKAERCAELLRHAGAQEADTTGGPPLASLAQLEKRPALLELHPTIDPRDPEEGDFAGTTVVVDAIIGQDGRPAFARASCTDCRLSLSAVQTVLRSRFQPGIQRGAPVATQVRIPIIFRDRPKTTFEFQALDVKPQVLTRVPPRYPFQLKQQGITGQAVVQFFVAEDGSVEDVVVVSATHEGFGASAVEAVRQWRFKPGILDGRAVACRMQQAFPFLLR